MSDTTQAVYDAVRSRIGSVNVAAVIEDFLRSADIDHHFRLAAYTIEIAMTTPSVLMRPRIGMDGPKWWALYGDNLQDGVAGFGDSPAEAMADFDKNWYAKLPQPSSEGRSNG